MRERKNWKRKLNIKKETSNYDEGQSNVITSREYASILKLWYIVLHFFDYCYFHLPFFSLLFSFAINSDLIVLMYYYSSVILLSFQLLQLQFCCLFILTLMNDVIFEECFSFLIIKTQIQFTQCSVIHQGFTYLSCSFCPNILICSLLQNSFYVSL